MPKTFTSSASPSLLDGLDLSCPDWLAKRPWLGDTLLAIIVGGLSAAMVTSLQDALDESVLASPSGLDIYRDRVVGEDVGRPANVIPIVEPGREVVKRTVRTLDECDVVGAVRSFEKGADLVASPATTSSISCPDGSPKRVDSP